MKVDAPWTPEEVCGLRDWQACGWVHPFTCGGGDRHDELHTSTARDRSESEPGLLIPTRAGWVCPACGYYQNWAHDFMLKGPPPHPFAQVGS